MQIFSGNVCNNRESVGRANWLFTKPCFFFSWNMPLHFLYYIHYISTSILKYVFLSELLKIFCILVYYFDNNILPFKTQPNYLKH